MLSIEQVRENLADRNPKAVAEATGLAYNTVWRIKTGRFNEPSYTAVKTLSDYLQGKGNGRSD